MLSAKLLNRTNQLCAQPDRNALVEFIPSIGRSRYILEDTPADSISNRFTSFKPLKLGMMHRPGRLAGTLGQDAWLAVVLTILMLPHPSHILALGGSTLE